MPLLKHLTGHVSHAGDSLARKVGGSRAGIPRRRRISNVKPSSGQTDLRPWLDRRHHSKTGNCAPMVVESAATLAGRPAIGPIRGRAESTARRSPGCWGRSRCWCCRWRSRHVLANDLEGGAVGRAHLIQRSVSTPVRDPDRVLRVGRSRLPSCLTSVRTAAPGLRSERGYGGRWSHGHQRAGDETARCGIAGTGQRVFVR